MNTPAKTRKTAKKRTAGELTRTTKVVKRTPVGNVYAGLIPNRLSGPIPAIKRCQLVYCENIFVTLASGVYDYIFSCNGMYDPNITGTGHQPMYFDQLMALYNHYTVHSSTLEFQPLWSDTTNRAMIVGMYIDDVASPPGFSNDYGERPGAKQLAYQMDGNTLPIMRLAWNAERAFGKVYSSNASFRGNSSSNPAEQQYYCLQFTEPTGGAGSFAFRVKITFNVTLTEFKSVTGS